MAGDVWKKKECKNWMRGAKGLEYLQEGLQGFVGDKILQCRDQSVQTITDNLPAGSLTQCNQCTTQNLLPEHAHPKHTCERNKCKQGNTRNCFGSKPKGRRKCPNGICSKLYDTIVSEHCYKDPLWKNTDPRTWCSDPYGWSFAKCFQTTKSEGMSAYTTDAAGLLSILLNNQYIQQWLTCKHMGSKTACPFFKARDIRNEILHSAKLELDEPTLHEYLDTFMIVLQDPKCLVSNEESKQAVDNLKQLKRNQINISHDDEKEYFRMRDEALSQLEEREARALHEIDDRKVAALSTVDDARRIATKDVDITAKTALCKVEETVSIAKQDVENTAKTTLCGVEEAGKEAKQEIENVSKTACCEVEDAGRGAKQDVEHATKTALFSVEEAKQDLIEQTQSALSLIEMTKCNVIEQLREHNKIHVVSGAFEAKPLPNVETQYSHITEAMLHDQELIHVMTVIDKAFEKLVEYMEPDPILDCAVAFNLFGYRETRDIKEQDKPFEKNRGILDAVRSKGKEAFTNLKTCLNETHQSMLVKLLDCIEKDENTSVLETQIHEEMVKKMPQVFKDLQSDLITYYRETCSTIPICPCLDEIDAHLLQVYVPPYPLYSQETDILKQMSYKGTKVAEETKIDSLHKLFNKQSKKCRNIYLTAEPGLGKTSFVKQLVLNWCQAHNPVSDEVDYFNQSDVSEMEQFDFVFLIFLRETDETDVGERHVEAMIQNLIIDALARQGTYTPEVLKKVLVQEKCLIVLDGLDEWYLTYIPKRLSRASCTYLTTSQPWKFCMLSLNSAQIDQHVEIKDIENICTCKLVPSILSLFEERGCLREDVPNSAEAYEKFICMLYEKKIYHLHSSPVILVQLIYLWNLTKEIGNSQCEIYSYVVDALFSIAMKKVKLLSKFKNKLPTHIDTFQSPFCETYYDLMIKLGKLAFVTLFSKNKESSLVFEEAIAVKYIPVDENTTADEILSTCVQTGLLSKQSVYVRARRKKYIYSFYHKTIQEYFAALYIQANYENEFHVQQRIQKRCYSVSAVLEMETVFVFLSGFNPHVAGVILNSLQNTICKDENTEAFLCRVCDSGDSGHKQLKAIQDMTVSCEIEIVNNGHGNQYLASDDIFVDNVDYDHFFSAVIAKSTSDSQDEQYLPLAHVFVDRDSFSQALKKLIKLNSNNIKSLVVANDYFSAVCSELQLTEMQSSLNKLEIDHIMSSPIKGLQGIMAKSAKALKAFSLKKDHAVLGDIEIRSIVTDQLVKIEQLESLSLQGFKMTHDMLEELFKFFSQNSQMAHLRLDIRCRDHGYRKCSGFKLQLDEHEHLEKLRLHGVPVTNVQLNEHLDHLTLDNVPLSKCQGDLSSLMYCDVSNVSADGVSALFGCLPAEPRLQTFKCKGVESTEDATSLSNKLPYMVYLQDIEVVDIDLDERPLVLPNNMKHNNRVKVVLNRVYSTSDYFNSFIDTILKYEQAISVNLENVHSEKSQEPVKTNMSKGNDPMCSSDRIEFILLDNELTSDALQQFVSKVQKWVPSASVLLWIQGVKVKHNASTGEQKTRNLDNTSARANSENSSADGKKYIKIRDLKLPCSIFKQFVDTVQKCQHSVILKLFNVTVKDDTITRQKEALDKAFTTTYALKWYISTYGKEELEKHDRTIPYKTFKHFVDTVLKFEQSVTVMLKSDTEEDITSEEQQEAVNQDMSSLCALTGRSTCGKRYFEIDDEKITYSTFEQFMETVENCQYPVEVTLIQRDPFPECYKDKTEHVRFSSSFIVLEEDENVFRFMTKSQDEI